MQNWISSWRLSLYLFAKKIFPPESFICIFISSLAASVALVSVIRLCMKAFEYELSLLHMNHIKRLVSLYFNLCL